MFNIDDDILVVEVIEGGEEVEDNFIQFSPEEIKHLLSLV